MLSKRQKMITALIAGVVAGGGLYFLYLLRAHTYLTDEPSACVNCHIMSPYYATWMHSSHSRNATCNDCHVPHENFVKKWTFKGMDGVKHVAAFLTSSEPQVIQAHPASSQVIMNNCIRCHEQLNTELVKTGRIDYTPLIKEIRGRGLMVGVELTVPVKGVREPLLFEERIFTGYSGLYTLRILPPLVLSKKEVDIFVGSLKKVLDGYYENSR